MKAARSLYVLRATCRRRPTNPTTPTNFLSPHTCRRFTNSPILEKIQTHKLSDIGEGVKEVQIIQWFVQEGAAVEEWAPLCEVQSDKASVEITSKYTGVIKKLHFERDAIVQVGDGMLDIEVESEDADDEPTDQDETNDSQEQEGQAQEQRRGTPKEDVVAEGKSQEPTRRTQRGIQLEEGPDTSTGTSGKHSNLATPAVRGLLKDHGLDIADVRGTGKDGRVLKEDIYHHLENSSSSQPTTSVSMQEPQVDSKQTEISQNLSPVQAAMFKSMTKSLSIPHFLFSDRINITSLAAIRARLNASRNPDATPKFSYLPFVIKAVSLALNQYPLLNARLDTTSDSGKPSLIYRKNHNISIAMDTPAGLMVPVVKSVNSKSITSIAQEIQRLSQLGQSGKLSNEELNGGTITVSNVGNIGGEVVAPVIVEGQLAILGIGKIRPTPVFAADGTTVERADLMSTSWSADHRVVDGATMARMAGLVQKYLEQPESMMVNMS